MDLYLELCQYVEFLYKSKFLYGIHYDRKIECLYD